MQRARKNTRELKRILKESERIDENIRGYDQIPRRTEKIKEISKIVRHNLKQYANDPKEYERIRENTRKIA